ncbi:hypothetical protein ACH5RR_006246 [Cinchona calisaya]|uniref:Uncharacterized protein n=1 Tax=Cinchona calisaya TaxID=153742 RepID=A0ABD3ANF1_9GENT
MTRIEDRSTWMRKCHGPMGPAIRQIIKDTVKISRQQKSLSNGKGGYEVKKGRTVAGGGGPEEVAARGGVAEEVATGGRGVEEAVAGGRGVEEAIAGGVGTGEPVAGAGETGSRETNADTAGSGFGSVACTEEAAIVSNANADGNYANSERNNGNVLVSEEVLVSIQ